MKKKTKLTKAIGKRYSAKLLFQYRVLRTISKMRICEERIVSFRSETAREALGTARKLGKSARFSHGNSDGKKVIFELVGILEILCLDPVCEANEVWYEITKRRLPKERASEIIPQESRLNAILCENNRNQEKENGNKR